MALVTSVHNVPLHPNFPMPLTMYDRDMYNFQIESYHESSSAADKLVIYHPGSGSSNFIGDGPFVQELLAKGYRVLSFAYFGMEGASPISPYRYGYGNVNAPHFTSMWIKHAWEVATSIEWALAEFGNLPFVLAGHSRGAAACLAWAAGYCGEDAAAPSTYTTLQGLFANAATVAGLGDLSWNDMNRNINSMSTIWALNEVKTVATYGGADTYAPPDYVKRLQQVLSVDQEFYLTSPGPSVGHFWINTPSHAELAAMWIEQLMEGQTITLQDGVTPAIPGPLA